MAAPSADLLAALLELVRISAREGAAEALLQANPPAPALAPLIDKQELARSLRVCQAKKTSNSYAKRLRRDLFKAGVWRLPPIEVRATKPGMRRDLGKVAKGTKLAPNPLDPLYFPTASTLPVDFHSFRRAFSTALAEAGTNVQLAMNLAAHSDPRVHGRYVMKTRQMRTTPEAALPPLPPATVVLAAEPLIATIVVASDPDPGTEAPRNVTARDVSTLPRRGRRTQPRGIVAPAAGLEPATRRLTAACSTD